MKETRAGLGDGIGAYLLWGTFPLFFTLIAVANPFEVVSWRVITTLIVCALIVTVTRRWDRIVSVLRAPKTFGLFALSSILLYANWQIFVLGVITGHVLETALGYFINPLFTILFGVIFWREKLSRLQWVAVIIAGAGVLFSAISYGRVPWIALGLAVTFGLYGVVHQRIEHVDGVTGLTVETLVSVPIGLVQLAVVASVAGLSAFAHGGVITSLVLVSGLLTAIPLILFGEAARRLPLTYIGFLQFLTPILGFIFGFFVMGEELPLARWIGFIAVWIALMFLIADMVVRLRRAPDPGTAHQPHTGPIPLD
ncbi:EamA family transporter RarD [Leucobacter komagatae]|uniref:Protein rarD n=1 Tax=Leucobacter komagatae TaxID=55969 RepID=A0A0D0IRY3_9MICO|nr:EamA family transporter RarD [Leucobacter komagatae]KIP52243.1 protein rarD [Leucobacter komagatae]